MNNIESERRRLHMTQEDLGNKLGVSYKRISRWENEQVPIPSSAAVKMSHLFGCSIDYLFGLSDDRKAIFTS